MNLPLIYSTLTLLLIMQMGRAASSGPSWNDLRIHKAGYLEKLISKAKPGEALELRKGIYLLNAQGNPIDLSGIDRIVAKDPGEVVIRTWTETGNRPLVTTRSLQIEDIIFDGPVSLVSGEWIFKDSSIRLSPTTGSASPDWYAALFSDQAEVLWEAGKIEMDFPAVHRGYHRNIYGVLASKAARFSFINTHLTSLNPKSYFDKAGLNSDLGAHINWQGGKIDNFVQNAWAGGEGSAIEFSDATLISLPCPAVETLSPYTIMAREKTRVSVLNCHLELGFVSSAGNLILRDTSIDGVGNPMIVTGVSAWQPGFIKLDNCRISNWKWACLRVNDNATVEMTRTLLSDSRIGCWVLPGKPQVTAIECTIQDNSFEGIRCLLEDPSGLKLIRCEITRNGVGLSAINPSQKAPQLEDTRIRGNYRIDQVLLAPTTNPLEEYKKIPTGKPNSFTLQTVKVSPAEVTARRKEPLYLIAHFNNLCVAYHANYSPPFRAFRHNTKLSNTPPHDPYPDYSADKFARELLDMAWSQHGIWEIPQKIDGLTRLMLATHQIAPSDTTRDILALLRGMAWRIRVWKGIEDVETRQHAEALDPQRLEAICMEGTLGPKAVAVATMLLHSYGKLDATQTADRLASLKIDTHDREPTLAEFQWWIKGTEKNPNEDIRVAYEGSTIETEIVSVALNNEEASAEVKYQAALACWYGIGVRQDREQAKKLFSEASQAGSHKAAGFLAYENMKVATLQF